MIDHDEARRRSSLALDRELAPDHEADLRAHLEGCDECERHRDRLAEVRDLLRDESDPVPDVSARVLAAIGARAARDGDDEDGFEAVRAALLDEADAAPDVSARVLAAIAGSTVDDRDDPVGLERQRADVGASRSEIELHVVAHHVETPNAEGVSPTAETRVIERAGWTRHRGATVRWLPAAACLVVGLLLGSVLVGGFRSTPPTAAAQVPEEVAAAQVEIHSLSASIEITERGWNQDVPERTFAGTIDYEAPESLALHLDDTTAYPTSSWVANDVDLVRTSGEWWARGPRDCPSTAQPACTAPEPRLEVIESLEPYDAGAPVALDLVVPVRSFLRSAEPPSLGARSIDGRDAVGVQVTAAQVTPLLDGLRPAGNLRQFFPTDRVALWLDAATWNPLLVEVSAVDDPDRATWAVNRGYVERPGDQILVVAVRGARVNQGIDRSRLEPSPAGGVRRNAGYIELGQAGPATRPPPGAPDPSDAVMVDPSALPRGIAPASLGIIGAGTDHPVVVQTWSSGRGWVKVAATTGWDGSRLFGDLGSPVRRIDGSDGSVRYSALDGSQVAIHAPGLDVVVTGSFDVEVLDAVAVGTGLRGTPVPEGWDEAATESVASATELLPGLLVPSPEAGFAAAAVRADGNVVTQAYAGAGTRGFVVVEAPGERLGPPLDMDSGGVNVRGVDGRFSAARGELEWVEGERVHRLTSPSLSRSELVALADAMVAA